MTLKVTRCRKYEEVKDNITYPCITQIKIDGIFGCVKDGIVYSRALKAIPNKYVQKLFGHLEGFCGELLLSPDPNARLFNETHSAVMTVEGEPEVYFHIYDSWERETGYEEWHTNNKHRNNPEVLNSNVKLHPYWVLDTETALEDFYNHVISGGLEGIIGRNPKEPYKQGAASKTKWELFKRKPLDDAEFEVLGFEEEMISTVESTLDNLGRKKKLKKKGQEVPSGMLANFVCEYNGFKFSVPVRKGHTNGQRKQMWEERESYLGKTIKVEFEGVAKNVPRHPRFAGFRSDIDIIKD